MLWIRPVYDVTGSQLKGLALCRTNGDITVDEDILIHFPANEPGNAVKAEARTTYNQDTQWGNCILAGDRRASFWELAGLRG